MIAPWIMLSISVVLALVTLVLVLVVLIAGSRSLEGGNIGEVFPVLPFTDVSTS